jgi:FMN reductase (NADPH)
MNKNLKQNMEMLKILQDHRSIREFLDKQIPEDDIRNIIRSAQAAPSSSHGQSYSIISIINSEQKSKLAEYAGNQKQVENCSHFFVFCADLYRIKKIAEKQEVDMTESMDSVEMFLVATIDAALVAQNTANAAEALGLGTVYIGGLRNNPYKVSKLLKLPTRVFPLFGMCIGYPDPNKIPEKKPRLPQEAIFYENEYPPFEQTYPYIEQYDEIMKQYYLKRTDGKRADTWSDTMIDKRKIPRRMFMKPFLHDKGFPLT